MKPRLEPVPNNPASEKVLRMSGEVDFASSVQWVRRLRTQSAEWFRRDAAVVESRPAFVILDWSEVQSVDSSALSVWLELERDAQRVGVRVVHRAVPASLKSLAKLYGVEGLMARAS